MPPEGSLNELSQAFNSVVVLVEDFELPYSLEGWKKRGVEVLHFPIPDFSAPSLEELLTVLQWIEAKVQEGKRVLIHCIGGCGRSGTVSVAWLMYSRRLPLRQALSEVRRLRHCAVETESQIELLKGLERTIKTR
nr:dual specificity protein phosphatase family protein [Thermococcus sp. 21S9]